MADIIFRLPGNAQYSYVEVKFDTDDQEYADPDARMNVLTGALADLNNTYPQATTPVASAPPQAARPAGGKSNGAETTCVHGDRKRVAKGNWVAWFCPLEEKSQQCKAEFEKKN